jgi:hypothetical protein
MAVSLAWPAILYGNYHHSGGLRGNPGERPHIRAHPKRYLSKSLVSGRVMPERPPFFQID